MKTLALKWSHDKRPHLSILDQQLLPQVEKWIDIKTYQEMILAIKTLQVRGAPLIGVAAVLCLAQSALHGSNQSELLSQADALIEARPTAVNLMNCVECLKKIIQTGAGAEQILSEAMAMAEEDIQLCKKMSQRGAELIQSK